MVEHQCCCQCFYLLRLVKFIIEFHSIQCLNLSGTVKDKIKIVVVA